MDKLAKKTEALESLLKETVSELRGLREQINFLKMNFSTLVRDRDEKIRNQRKMIADLTDQRDRFLRELRERGLNPDEAEGRA